MSETGETPQAPLPEQEQPQPRLEDMPEFQALGKEEQEKLLALRERMMNEMGDPVNQVSRNLYEGGFWQGMGETLKPHLQKYKELKIKDLKATASLALSLIPVLGEGKGLGKGLLGIHAKNGLMSTPPKEWIFEPITRGKNALKFGKRGYNYIRTYSAAEHLKNAIQAGKETPGVLKTLGANVKDKIRFIRAPMGAKFAVEKSAWKQFSQASKEGVAAFANNMNATAGVERIAKIQNVRDNAAAVAYMRTLREAGIPRDFKWYQFIEKWNNRAVLKAAKQSKELAKSIGNTLVNKEIASRLAGKNSVVKGIEATILKAAPKTIETTAVLSKSMKVKQFIERALDTTPDVPSWLSTTTAFAEFFGMHGIDAIPSVLQLMKNMYSGLKLSKDMAQDVFVYTVNRALYKRAERAQAAQVFVPTAA